MAIDNQILQETEKKMKKSRESLQGEFARLRTGRASPALLDNVRVDYYGTQTPINQLASISIPESRSIVITPWDKGVLAEIEKGIQKSDLGLTPINDGKIIRVNLPVPTEERRKELVKHAKKMTEEARISVRNARRESNDGLKKKQKQGEITEDDLRKGESEIQKLTDKMIAEVDSLLSHKENEIMEL